MDRKIKSFEKSRFTIVQVHEHVRIRGPSVSIGFIFEAMKNSNAIAVALVQIGVGEVDFDCEKTTIEHGLLVEIRNFDIEHIRFDWAMILCGFMAVIP